MSVAVVERPVRTAESQKQFAENAYQYPGIPTTCDGAEAVVHAEIHISQAAGAYPITSSTTMGGGFNASVMNGHKNLWGDSLMFFEPESEHSAASVCEGFAIVDTLKDCKAFTVFERMDDPLSTSGNQLTREIKAAFCDAVTGQNGQEKITHVPQVYHGAAGLGSRDVRPGDIIAAFHNMMIGGPDYFSVGIDHKTALTRKDDPDLRPKGGFSMRGHSVGGFGSVTTNKVIATIAGNVFGKDVQAYPKYGSEKKGLPTTYYLTIADTHVNMHSELEKVELLCVNDPTAMLSELTLKGLVAGGAIFMQSPYSNPDDVWRRIPLQNQHTIREKKVRVYYCDMVQIAREVASEADLQMRMQGIVLLGAFLRLTPYVREAEMSDEQLDAGVEKALTKYFGKRGTQVVQENMHCIKRGRSEMKEIPESVVYAH